VLQLTVPKLPFKGVLQVQDPTLQFNTTTAVPSVEPSIFRRILKYTVLAFVLLHILEQIPKVSTPIDNYSDLGAFQQKENKPEYEDFSDDPTFGLNMWSPTADDVGNAHTGSWEEGQLTSESHERHQMVAGIQASEVQMAEPGMGLRDRIDHALGWRELGG